MNFKDLSSGFFFFFLSSLFFMLSACGCLFYFYGGPATAIYTSTCVFINNNCSAGATFFLSRVILLREIDPLYICNVFISNTRSREFFYLRFFKVFPFSSFHMRIFRRIISSSPVYSCAVNNFL